MSQENQRILKKLQQVWGNQPDTRLGKLLTDIARSHRTDLSGDLSAVEDSELEKWLDTLIRTEKIVSTPEPIYSVSSAIANWHETLAETINTCPDNSVICVNNEYIVGLGELARQRLCPDKTIEFTVEPEVGKHKNLGCGFDDFVF